MKEKKQLADGGFRLRLWCAIALILFGIPCLAGAIYIITVNNGSLGDDLVLIFLIGIIVGSIAIGESITQFIAASLGKTDKGANILSIVIGALFSVVGIGLLGVVGGVKGIRHIKQLDAACEQPPEDGKKYDNGFKFRLAMAIIWLIIAVPFAIVDILDTPVAISDGEYEGIIYIAFTAVLPLLLAILHFVAAFRGKRRIWANILNIAGGCLFALAIVGILGIVGGERGMKVVNRARAEKKKLKKEEAERRRLEKERLRAEARAHEEVLDEGTPEEPGVYTTRQEFIQPKMSEKGKKGIMIAIIASYSVFFLAGILLASVPAFANIIVGLGICEDISGRAYAITIGVMWVALTPTIGYYFATISPYSLSKKHKIIIAAATTGLLVVMNVVFFIVINAAKIDDLIPVNEFYEGSDTWFVPVTMVFASLGLAVCYALTMFRIDPEKIKTNKPELSEGHDFFETVKYIFAMIGYFVLSLVKKIFVAKEKQPDIFILVAAVLLTWLAYFVSFVIAIILIVAFVVVIVLAFTGLVKFAYYNGSSEKLVIYENGQNVELTCRPNAPAEDGEKVYEDAYGNCYISTDGGKTVYKK